MRLAGVLGTSNAPKEGKVRREEGHPDPRRNGAAFGERTGLDVSAWEDEASLRGLETLGASHCMHMRVKGKAMLHRKPEGVLVLCLGCTACLRGAG